MVAAAMAEQLGEDGSKVKEKHIQWAAMMVKRGVIVDLHIGRTRFERKMTKEDLGLDDVSDMEFESFMAEHYQLGTKLLIPKRVLLLFNRIENRARANLERHSFSSPYGHFVPVTAYSQWKKRNEDLKAEYEKEKEQLKKDIPALTKEVVEKYRTAAAKIYERTTKSKPLEKFTEDFIENLEGQIPDADDVSNTFYFTEDIYYVPLPTEVEEEFLKAEVLRREASAEQAKTQAEFEKARLEVEMHRDTVAKIMENKRKKIDSLMDSVSGELRGAIFTTLKDVLESIKSKSVLTCSSVKSLRGLVERTRMMNFMGDDDIEQALGKIEEILGEKFRDKSIKDVAHIFHSIATEFREQALEKSDLPEMGEFGYLL